jgi:hypothetical protein
MNLSQLIDRFRTAIADAVIRAYPPVYDAETRRTCGFDLRRLLRRPLGAQADAIRAAALSLQRQGSTLFVGEMGTGKSLCAAAATYFAGFERAFILCPPHLVRKWRREVLKTVPGCRATIVRTITDLERCRAEPAPPGSVHFVICSREQAKLGYRWQPAAALRPARGGNGGLLRDEVGRTERLVCCPACHAPATDEEDVPLTLADLRTKKRRCRACGAPLWGADRTGPRRFPLADYVRRRMRGFFPLLILDELQEYKARGSGQGLAAATLAEACGKTLSLTGTLFGGYSSTLFYLLWRFSPQVRTSFGYGDETRWITRYGVVERITKLDPDARVGDGRRSKRRSYLTRIVEKPGVSPAVLFHLISNSIFLRLSDVAEGLPPYREGVHLFGLDREDVGATGSESEGEAGEAQTGGRGAGPDAPPRSQAAAYRRLESQLTRAVRAALQSGSKRLLGTYLQALLAYPDACTRGETVVDSVSGEVIAHAPALPDDRLYPKERALVELVRRERARQRRVLCFVTHTDRRDITPRLESILAREGFRVAVLKAQTVPPERREEWIARRAAEGVDLLLTNPRLVQTGLDYEESGAVSRAKATSACYSPSSSRIHFSSPASRSWSAASGVG